jgi:hypothetical protein
LPAAVAGVVGTTVMDLVWYPRYRRDGGDDGFLDWEFATSTASFDEASAPGQVGKKLADAVGIDLPAEAAGRTTNIMHWLTGIGYGCSRRSVASARRVGVRVVGQTVDEVSQPRDGIRIRGLIELL